MDEILNLIESVSEGFPSYFFLSPLCNLVIHAKDPKGAITDSCEPVHDSFRKIKRVLTLKFHCS